MAADRLLAGEYPDEAARRRAIRFLGWVAVSSRGKEFGWWDVPGWVGRAWMTFAWRVLVISLFAGTGAITVAAGALLPGGGLADAITPVAVTAILAVIFILPAGAVRAAVPVVIRPRMPRNRSELLLLLVLGLCTGPLLRPVMARNWAIVVTDYRQYRRDTIRGALTCMLSGLPLALLALVWGPAMLRAGLAMACWGLALAVMDSKIALCRAGELALLLRWRRIVNLPRLLDTATARQVLITANGRYSFRDAALRQALADAYTGTAAARVRQVDEAVRAATGGPRPWLLRMLSGRRQLRISIAVAGGAMIALLGKVISGFVSAGPGGWGHAALALAGAAVAGVAVGMIAWMIVFLGLDQLVRLTRWSLGRTARMSRPARVRAMIVTVAVVAALVWGIGPGRVRHGVAVTGVVVMAPVIVIAVGGWACAGVNRRCRGSARRVVRYLPDGLLAFVMAAGFLLIADPRSPVAQGAAGLLFPVAVRFSVAAWRVMNSARRLAIRAAADIVTSLLLGAAVVLLFVWLAGLLQMPPAEVGAVRDISHEAGSVIDLPWWTWVLTYLVLAAASLSFLRWPARLAAPARRFERLRIPGSVNLARRSLTGVHIGLLVTMLVGLAGPPATIAVLRARLAQRYTVTLEDSLRLRGELAAYQRIQREFDAPSPPSVTATLAGIVVAIDEAGKPAGGSHAPTGTELDLAHRIGELQAVTLGGDMSPSAAAADGARTAQSAAASARRTGFDAPVRDAADLGQRAGELSKQQHDKDSLGKLADQAAELAATAVAGTLSIPHLSDSEVVQIVREYLSGLVEGSPLTKVFAAWADRIARPVTADVVVPVPGKLEAAAQAQLTTQLSASGSADPLAMLDLQQRLSADTAIVATVAIVNQVRFLQEDSGPCDGCFRPGQPGEEDGGYHEPDVVP